MELVFRPEGVCSREMHIEYDENNIVTSAHVIGGCNGNLQGICALIVGLPFETVVSKLEGIHCGPRPTSCPDQMAKGIKKHLLK